MRYFSRRLVAIHVLAILAIALCLALSNWQWVRAHSDRSAKPTSEQSFNELSPLRNFLPPQSVGVPTQVAGEWQSGARKVFPERIADGPQLINPNPGSQTIVDWVGPVGSWVVDILNLSDGSAVAVVRGFSSSPDAIPQATGSATIKGVMQPSEDSPHVDLVQLPHYITTPELMSLTKRTLHDGYFVAAEPTAGLQQVVPIFEKPIHVGLNWRNVVYTGNWIAFAFIVLAMWVRVVRDELEASTL